MLIVSRMWHEREREKAREREGEERETMKKNKLNLPPNFKNKEIKEQERVISVPSSREKEREGEKINNNKKFKNYK